MFERKKNYLLADFSQLHVLFDAVHFILEFGSGGTHVRDHTADITDDGSENQDSTHEIESYEEKFNVPDRTRNFTNRGQNQGGPIETVDVTTE